MAEHGNPEHSSGRTSALFRRESDIDLAVSGGNAERFLLDAEETTSTLLKYDVVNLDHPLRPELLKSIEREGKVLFEKV